MNRWGWKTLTAAGLVVAAACSDEGPTGSIGPSLDFTITAPTQLPSKGVIDVEVRLTRTEGVEHPIEIVFEKANVGEPFFGVARMLLLTADARTAVTRIPVLMDPRIRVTVRESSAVELSVSKTIQVDVLDFR